MWSIITHHPIAAAASHIIQSQSRKTPHVPAHHQHARGIEAGWPGRHALRHGRLGSREPGPPQFSGGRTRLERRLSQLQYSRVQSLI
jgi:hypothetical protein